jgi:hypothetical protein
MAASGMRVQGSCWSSSPVMYAANSRLRFVGSSQGVSRCQFTYTSLVQRAWVSSSTTRGKDALPTSNAKRTTPALHTSIGSARYCLPKASSGAAYGGLPHASPRGRSFPLYRKTLHRPKSDILRLPASIVENISAPNTHPINAAAK